MKNYIIKSSDKLRVDKFLQDKLDISRNKIQQLIKDNQVLVNSESTKSSYTLKEGDKLSIDLESMQEEEIRPENIDIDIVYEDEYLLVVNKANNMVVHPAEGHSSGTLVNALMYHVDKLSTYNDDENRPGIVHRIDKDTTGLLIVAKDNKTHEILTEMIKNKDVKRKYLALVHGVINNDTATIDAPIGRDPQNRKRMAVTSINSKPAVTHFRVLKRYSNKTLIEVELETGRTHQIRVHLKYIKYPIVNDPIYSRSRLIDKTGQVLHAKSLEFVHPISKEKLYFEAETPACFNEILKLVEEENNES